MNGVGITKWILAYPQLTDLVRDAIGVMTGNEYAGFYFDEVSSEWDYWVSDNNDNTASNKYYTRDELISILKGV